MIHVLTQYIIIKNRFFFSCTWLAVVADSRGFPATVVDVSLRLGWCFFAQTNNNVFASNFPPTFQSRFHQPKVELVCLQSSPHSQSLLIFCTHTHKKNIHQHNLSPAFVCWFTLGEKNLSKTTPNPTPSIFSSDLGRWKVKVCRCVTTKAFVFSAGVRCSLVKKSPPAWCRWQVVVNNLFLALIYGKYENIMTCHTRHSFRWHVCVNAQPREVEFVWKWYYHGWARLDKDPLVVRRDLIYDTHNQPMNCHNTGYFEIWLFYWSKPPERQL